METVIRNATIVNEGKVFQSDVLIKNHRINRIGSIPDSDSARNEIDATGLFLLPGCIDDQVHFREPGLTHKGEIYTEAKAAVAGGITSFMEMPNTIPQATTQELLEAKYKRADIASLANYSFFMGVTNHNIDEVLKTDPKNVCGIKIFMGSSTGDMLVDNEKVLESIFVNAPTLVALHCEDEETIKLNLAKAMADFGDDIPFHYHPIIRNSEACYKSSSFAISLAEKHNSRIHILHISTEAETNLFRNDIPLEQKRITSEACIHHLWFSDNDYATKGPWIKWNPAVKTINDRNAIRKALLDDRIDIIATDHAPHTKEEKENKYTSCPSGGPLVQHALPAMLEFVKEGWINIEKVVEKMAHAPALCFQISERGFIREGYFADLALVDMNANWKVNKSNILYKCGWSPFEGTTFNSKVVKTFVNGHLAYDNGSFNETKKGMRLQFNRQ
jgi:dihydroorotase